MVSGFSLALLAAAAVFVKIDASCIINNYYVVVPNEFTAVDGNGNNELPFNRASLANTISTRYQQLYHGWAITTTRSVVWITELAFRKDAHVGRPSFHSSFVHNISIRLSTTEKDPTTLSNTFSENVGTDETIIWDASTIPLLLSSESVEDPMSTSEPKSRLFDITIRLPTPFRFDPQRGNLLLDVRDANATQTATTTLDAAIHPDIARAYTTIFDGVDSINGTVKRNYGLVTRLKTISVDKEEEHETLCGNDNHNNTMQTQLPTAPSKSWTTTILPTFNASNQPTKPAMTTIPTMTPSNGLPNTPPGASSAISSGMDCRFTMFPHLLLAGNFGLAFWLYL